MTAFGAIGVAVRETADIVIGADRTGLVAA